MGVSWAYKLLVGNLSNFMHLYISNQGITFQSLYNFLLMEGQNDLLILKNDGSWLIEKIKSDDKIKNLVESLYKGYNYLVIYLQKVKKKNNNKRKESHSLLY